MYYDERNSIVLAGLHPIVAEKAREWLAELDSAGLEVLLNEGFRSLERQKALYNQGRITPGPVVTNSKPGQSYHNYGLAIDFYPTNAKGKLIDVPRKTYAEVAKKLGFEWGGDWRTILDQPHLQYTFGLSIQDLLAGKRPPSESKVYLTDPKAAERRRARRAKRVGR